MRNDRERELDTLAVGELVWVYEAPCIREVEILGIASDFEYKDFVAPLGYYVKSVLDGLGGVPHEPEFVSRMVVFRRPAERDELIEQLRDHAATLEYQADELSAERAGVAPDAPRT